MIPVRQIVSTSDAFFGLQKHAAYFYQPRFTGQIRPSDGLEMLKILFALNNMAARLLDLQFEGLQRSQTEHRAHASFAYIDACV